MKKIKNASQQAKSIVQYAPEVVSMASAAVRRLQRLLNICDYQMNAIGAKRTESKNVSQRDLIALMRMVLNIQKALDKYTAIAYPSTTLTSLVGIETGLENSPTDPNLDLGDELSTNASLLLENKTPPVIEIDEQDRVSAAHASRQTQYASHPQVASSDASSYGENFNLTTAHNKKLSKKQKFSHSFFQNKNFQMG